MYVSFLPIVAKPQAFVYADINIFIGKVLYIDIGQACIYSKNEDISHDRQVGRQRDLLKAFQFLFGEESPFHFCFLGIEQANRVSAYPFVLQGYIHHLFETLDML